MTGTFETNLGKNGDVSLECLSYEIKSATCAYCWLSSDTPHVVCVALEEKDIGLEECRAAGGKPFMAQVIRDTLVLPKELVSKMTSNDLILVCVGKRIEIWPKAEWETIEKDIDESTIADVLRGLGLADDV